MKPDRISIYRWSLFTIKLIDIKRLKLNAVNLF